MADFGLLESPKLILRKISVIENHEIPTLWKQILIDCLISSMDCLISSMDCLISNIDCLISCLDCLISSMDCLISSMDCLISSMDCLIVNHFENFFVKSILSFQLERTGQKIRTLFWSWCFEKSWSCHWIASRRNPGGSQSIGKSSWSNWSPTQFGVFGNFDWIQ